MSYITFQQKCLECGAIWNAASGVVGTSIIAQAPEECPQCKSLKIDFFRYGWPELDDDLEIVDLINKKYEN